MADKFTARYLAKIDGKAGVVLAEDYDKLIEALRDIQEFTRGYGDIAGIVHRKARAALTDSGGSEHG